MATTTIPLESLGDSITTAVVINWSKQKGDSVKEDDVIAVVETDKVTMDIRAKTAGVFIEGLVENGAEIEVGAPLYKLDEGATADSSTAVSAPAAADASPPPASPEAANPSSSSSPPKEPEVVVVPAMGESITQGMLAKWLVRVGDSVTNDAVVASIETDKVTVDVRSPNAGKVSEFFAEEGAEVTVGDPLFSLVQGASIAPSSTPETTSTPSPSPQQSAPAPPSPSPAPPQAVAPKSPAPSPSPVPAGSVRGETRVKMSRMRQRIAQRLKEAQNTAAMLTTFQELDMTNLMSLRARYKEEFEKLHGIKLGFMGAFVKASTAALLEIPSVNAVIDDSTREVVYHSYCDVSVAVASPTGLVVPVLRDTQNMNIADVERNIALYGKKAKEGTLALEEMAGGTFTISNGGVFGSLYGTPIINPPQSAILGIHATKMRAVVVDGKVEARPMMYLALTYDHRLVDGREAVTFLKSVANKVEDPVRMLLDL
eukprot:CAMPEP_0182420232 /NCGR_PEP_ID=MMETSP1167-20130531/4885_1 /TAXON_ID=2988 /ORGANISM="Mallomonas Sp, Strain CCMP3275" /LENGTH=484 /DNA_ID=CAMNT_0024595919 /DNA_START=278 /DNA_END=1732 /DNA_ORIENTATION=+